ncbi:MAG TPA: flavodoxin domain-containing protein [Bacteroidales bacterium]|nr:flavodoxin domain-containing protein [Bacteroidales bacterium]
MKKTLILYWAPGGSVEKAARMLSEIIGTEKTELFDVASFPVSRLSDFDNLIIGTATIGAETWRDANDNNKWMEFFDKTLGFDFSSMKVATFALGNQIFYPDHFVDSLGIIRQEIEQRKGKLIGYWPVEGYEFTDSMGYDNDLFFGLALDEDTQPELTRPRIMAWVEQLNREMNF